MEESRRLNKELNIIKEEREVLKKAADCIESNMRVINGSKFTGTTAWESMSITTMNGVTVKVHWTNEPYRWHVNDGEEVFVVLTGVVEMHYKKAHKIKKIILQPGDIFHAEVGCEHVAYPQGEARILVIEKEGSI